jgi:TonB family protein
VREPVRPRAPEGTLSLAGNIPPNARITVDNRRATLREKLSPGRHRLRVEAAGFQRYDAEVDIRSGITLPFTVQLQAATVAVTTPNVTAIPTPTAGGAAPAANCASPQVGVPNVNRVCYDVRPTPRTPPAIPAPASCTGVVRPATVLLQVSVSGDVVTASLQGRSSCPAFNEQAVAFSRDLAFQPATKGGQPVAAWIALLIRPTPRPR